MSEPVKSVPWVIGITGASGIAYARELLSTLALAYPTQNFEVIFSEAALRVMREEEDFPAIVGKLKVEEFLNIPSDRITIHSNRNIGASIASGSYPTAGMVIVPCSMKTLAAVAHGFCDNLIQRVADVTLKEHRRLILVPRETPLSAIHLENMLTLARLGCCILPAMPGFYQRPASVREVVLTVVQKIADQMTLPLEVLPRWGQESTQTFAQEQDVGESKH